MSRQQDLYTTIKQAVEIGLSIWPPRQDGSKAPLGNGWKERQAMPATLDELRHIYKGETLTGIGTICGKVSGNLECLDFDERGIYECFKEAANAIGLTDLLDRLDGGYKEHSPDGVHWLYRCEVIGGSTKLATRPKRPEEMKHENDKTKTLIETKGDGGYVIIAPTFGTVNTDGNYDLISGSIATIPTITPEERQDLFALARTFHIEPVEKIASDKKHIHRESSNAGGRPGDDFNKRATWPDILYPHGWEKVYEHNGVIYLRRPGKSRGISATIGHNGTDLLHCFTSSSQFDPNRSYTKFTAYAVLNHDSDFSSAAEELVRHGYGDKSNTRENQRKAKYNGHDPESWPDPLPLPDELPPVDPFDMDLLPNTLKPWAVDIVERFQCPPDYVGTAIMTAVASVVGRKIVIRPQAQTDWTVVPNIWTLNVGRPGVMKSPAMEAALSPLRLLSARAGEVFHYQQEEYQRRVRLLKIQAEEAEKLARQELKKNPKTDITSLLTGEEAVEPSLRRYIVNDSTIPALGELLRHNQNGFLVYRDEMVSLLKGLDREDAAGDRGFYLTAWNGDSSYTIDRIGRGLNLYIPAVCLSLLGSTQPARLAEYIRHAVKGTAGDDGLIQRFSMLVWPDMGSDWKDIDRWPDHEAKKRANKIFEYLDKLNPLEIGAIQDKGLTGEPDRIPYLRFDDPGRELFLEWRTTLEANLRGGDLPPALESHFSKYRKLIPAIALLIHLADGKSGPVEVSSVLAALAWGDYLKTHAHRAYASIITPDVATSKAILLRLKRGEIKVPFSARDIYRNGWSGLSEPERVIDALTFLEDRDWLASSTNLPSVHGGRPQVSYTVNPRGLL